MSADLAPLIEQAALEAVEAYKAIVRERENRDARERYRSDPEWHQRQDRERHSTPAAKQRKAEWSKQRLAEIRTDPDKLNAHRSYQREHKARMRANPESAARIRETKREWYSRNRDRINRARVEKARSARPDKPCVFCERDFPKADSRKIFCDRRCKANFYRARRKEQTNA